MTLKTRRDESRSPAYFSIQTGFLRDSAASFYRDRGLIFHRCRTTTLSPTSNIFRTNAKIFTGEQDVLERSHLNAKF